MHLFALVSLTGALLNWSAWRRAERPEREMETKILDLPEDVLDSALHVGTEFAWHLEDLPRAIQALRSAGLAILGGEVWAVRLKSDCIPSESTSQRDNLDPVKRRSGLVLFDDDELVIYGGIPRHGLGPLTVFHWEVKPRQEGEDWESFVARSAEETWEWVEATKVEYQVSPRLSRSVFYNVVLAGEGWETRTHWPRMRVD